MRVPETLQNLDLDCETLQTIEHEAYFLLRELLHLANADVVIQQRLLTRNFLISSPQLASCLYSIIFGVPIAKPKPFGTCDPWRLQKNLSRSTVFVHGPEIGRMIISSISRINRWRGHLGNALPVGLDRVTWNSEMTLRNQIGRRKLSDLDQFTSVIHSGSGILLTRVVPR